MADRMAVGGPTSAGMGGVRCSGPEPAEAGPEALLADPAWVAAVIGKLKDEEALEKRRGKGQGSREDDAQDKRKGKGQGRSDPKVG